MTTGVPLQRFLTRLIWICVVPLLLLAAYLAYDSVRENSVELDREAANIAKNFGIALDQHLAARIGALGVLAASPTAADDRRRAELYEEARAFQQGFGSHVILADLELKMLFNTRLPLGAPLPPRLPQPAGRSPAPTALETGAPAIGDSFMGPIAGQTMIAMAVPGKRQGKTAFVLLTAFEASHFQKRLDQVALPPGWGMALLDGSGASIARRGPSAAKTAGESPAPRRFVVQSEVSPWSVTVEIPAGIYRAQLATAVALMAMLILGATVAGVLGGTLAGRRLAGEMASLTVPATSERPQIAIKEITAVRNALDSATEQQAAADKALRESEERFRLASTGGDVWDWDLRLNKTWFPSEYWRRLGYETPAHDRAVAVFESLLLPEDLVRWRQAISDHIKEGKPYELEYRARTRSGEIRWFHTSGQSRRDADGRATYMAGTTFDITARKQAEAEVLKLNAELEQRVVERTAQLEAAKLRAEAADRIKSTFLATMSHELRTPLNSIIGFTGVLQQKLAGPLTAEQEKQLGIVRNASRHLLALINDVLDISKVEAGELSLAHEEFDLSSLLQHLAATFAPEAGRRGLEFALDVPAGDLRVIGDERRVGQVLNNLVFNALKFTPHGGVTVNCTRRDDACIIAVSDTGVGIRREDMDQLFRPFSQIDNGLTALREGTGLGLAISLQLAEAMGGTIIAESEWGKGSRFIFALPMGAGT